MIKKIENITKKVIAKKIVKVRKPKEEIEYNNISKILTEIGMSQVELADLAFNGDRAFVTKIVTGQRKCISLPTAIRISRVLGKKVEDVFIYKTPNQKK